MTEPMERLLPCPFCGEKRIFMNEPSKFHRYGSINCPACLVVLPGATSDTDELISAWNVRAVAQAVTGHPRHNVYFMCQCCEEENPENAVCCREDVAVMPDGTWLCDNCYSDCEKTAYGLVASDIEDFEFPQFEDLPRPAPYIDLALSSAERGQS